MRRLPVVRPHAVLLRLALLLALLVVPVPGPAWAAEPRRLDVAGAVALASAHSPVLAARRAGVEAADERVAASAARLLPRLTVNARYSRLSYVAPGQITLPFAVPGQPPPGPIVLGEAIQDQLATSLVLEQPVFAGLSLLNARKAAELARDAAAAQLQHERQELAVRAEEAYFTLLKSRLLLDVTEQSAKALTAHLERLERLSREGAATALDVSRTRTRVAGTRVLQLQARAAEAVAQQALLILLGLDADTALELTEPLDRALPLDGDALVPRALARAELRAARASAAAKEAQARAAGGGLWPQVVLRASAQLDQPNQRYFPLRNELNSSWDASVVVSWTAWDWLATWHGQRAAALDALAARALVAQLEDGARTDAARRLLEAHTSVQRIEASREAVEVAEQGLQRAQRLCDAGQAPCIGVLDAEAELTRLRAEWVQSRVDLRLADSQLRRAVGSVPVPGGANEETEEPPTVHEADDSAPLRETDAAHDAAAVRPEGTP